MAEKVKRRLSKGTLFTAVIAILATLLIFTTDAFSKDEVKRYIVFNDEVWDMESSMSPRDWITNQNSISFVVDLKEDFTKNQFLHPEEGDVVVDVPFTLTSLYGETEILSEAISITPLEDVEKGFIGEYEVTIITDAELSDDQLALTLEFPEENSWDIPAMTSRFSIERDKSVPSVQLEFLSEDPNFSESDFSLEPVTIDIDINDDNFVVTDETIVITKDEEEYEVPDQDWNNGHTQIEVSAPGYYQVTVTAEDRAGNVTTMTDSFGIITGDATLRIVDHRSNGQYNHDVVLEIENDLRLWSAEATIVKDGGEPFTQSFNTRGKRASLVLSEEGSYELIVTIRDVRNRDGYILGTPAFSIDKTSPVISTNVRDAGEYANTAVEVAITDTHSVTSTLEVYRNNRLVDHYEFENELNEVQLTEEGDYQLAINTVDAAGNESEEYLSLTIDSSSPVLSITGVEDGEFYNANKNEKEMVFTVEDRLIDLSESATFIRVLKDGVETDYEIPFELKENGSLALARYTFTESGHYELTLHSTDRLGHVAEEVTRSFTIDNEGPELSVTGTEDGARHGEDTTVHITVADLNLDAYQLTATKNGDEYVMDPFVESDGAATIEHVFTESGVYELTINTTDLAGNETTSSLTFTIDKSAPEIQFSGIQPGGHYNTNEETLHIVVEDYSFLVDESVVEIIRDGESIEAPEWDVYDELLWRMRGEMYLTFEDEGDYVVSVSSIDAFGNETSGTFEFTMDRTAPEVNLSGIAEKSFIQNGVLEISVTERYFDTNEVTVTVEKDGELLPSTPEFESTDVTSVLPLDFSEDGDYVVTVTATDEAGNQASYRTSTLTRSFTVDTTKPVIQIKGVTDGYKQKNQQVTIEVAEHNFANNHAVIQVTEKNIVNNTERTYNISQWDEVGEVSRVTREFNGELEYTIVVNSKDAAGNSADSKNVTFVIDFTNPVLSITGIDNQEHYQRQQAVFTVEDTNLDLANTVLNVVKVEGDKKLPYAVGELKKDSFNKASLRFQFKEEGQYVVNLQSTDKSGRTTTHEPIGFIIDQTTPVLAIDGVEHNEYYSTNKNVTVSVEEFNYKTNRVLVSVTKNGNAFDMGQFETDKKVVSKLGYNFNDDGLYTIQLQSEDKAGNGPVSVEKTFTIDQTNPTIDITGVEESVHYNVDKPVRVEIRDINLDSNVVTVTRNGTSYNMGGFRVNGQVASLDHTFTAEGDYVISVLATDQAGNQFSREISFTIDKTAPVITPMMGDRPIVDGEFINRVFTPQFVLDMEEDRIVSISLNGQNIGTTASAATTEMRYNYVAVARDEAGNETRESISFTVDTTRPELSITGIIDGFFNDNVRPMVTYSDTNLDPSRTKVTLNNQPYENGTLLEAERDYVLSAVVTDLADNVTSRTVVFTLDKTAPVIKFMDPLSERYFNSDILPELLVEDMTDYDIISMTLNGQEYNLGDPITSEGKHVMFFEVKDKAGNITQLSVEFIIDKTPPKVLYEGVVLNAKYFEPLNITLRLDNPEDTMQSVMINGEPYEGEILKDADGYPYVTLNIADVNPYNIQVTAFDEAGNESVTDIPFEIMEKSAFLQYYENKPLFFGSIFGVGLLGLGSILLMVRRRKGTIKEEPAEE